MIRMITDHIGVLAILFGDRHELIAWCTTGHHRVASRVTCAE